MPPPTPSPEESEIEKEIEDEALTRNEEIRNLNERIERLEQTTGDRTPNYGSYDKRSSFNQSENRPQLFPSSISKMGNKYTDHLSNHELHKIKSILEKDHSQKNITVLDEPLGNILDKTINFLTYSFDTFEKKIYKAELMEDLDEEEDRSILNTVKVYAMAFVLFCKEEENIIYIGFLMIFLSIIIYFTNIITAG